MTRERLDALTEALERRADDWPSLRAFFLSEARNDFLVEFLSNELGAVAQDSAHIVPHGVGQGSFTFIDKPDLEYSVRVITAFDRGRRIVKWLGMPQLIAVDGPGRLTVRTLEVPEEYDIEKFVAGVRLREGPVRDAGEGDLFVNDNRHEILDVCAATGPVIAQILTYRRGAPTLVWTFDPELSSLYCEQSSLAASRFRNVLRIADAAAIAVPADIYQLALASDSPQVVLQAIQSMLASGHPDSFPALHRATESNNPGLREGVSAVLDALFAGNG